MEGSKGRDVSSKENIETFNLYNAQNQNESEVQVYSNFSLSLSLSLKGTDKVVGVCRDMTRPKQAWWFKRNAGSEVKTSLQCS